jgi:hypothetical protein
MTTAPPPDRPQPRYCVSCGQQVLTTGPCPARSGKAHVVWFHDTTGLREEAQK